MEFSVDNLSFVERVNYLRIYEKNPEDDKAKLVYTFMKSVFCDKCKCSWAEDPQLHFWNDNEDSMICYFCSLENEKNNKE
jgi:hypothetical protein